MRKGLYKWLLAVGVALGVASCDEQGIPDIDDLMSPEDSVEVSGEGLQIQDITFSDDHKVMTLSARLLHNVGEYDLADSSQVVVKAWQEVKLFSGQTGDISYRQPSHTGPSVSWSKRPGSRFCFPLPPAFFSPPFVGYAVDGLEY